MRAKSVVLFGEAQAIWENTEASAEDKATAKEKFEAACALKSQADKLVELKSAVLDLKLIEGAEKDKARQAIQQRDGNFATLGQWLQKVHLTRPDLIHTAMATGRLRMSHLKSRPADADDKEERVEWLHKAGQASPETKVLVESVGASGGFLVPVEFRAELLSTEYEDNPIRQRATIIPMRRRQILVPALDQTGTAAGSTRQYGGVIASWTEEATQKAETEPEFRQIDLVAHKLVCYTELSDELLDDSAIALATLITRLFGGAIRWEEEWTFLRGTGAGQPLGVLNAGATHIEPRAVAGTIGVSDIMRMLMHHIGSQPVWHIARSALATLLQLNGPALNPSYIFIPNAREGMPATLMGFPIFYTEKLPLLGIQGDILLANWPDYYIGDRQQITIDSTNIFRFRHDITSWRAVHRIDGQPALSQPIRLADGVTDVSPFVILGDVAT